MWKLSQRSPARPDSDAAKAGRRRRRGRGSGLPSPGAQLRAGGRGSGQLARAREMVSVPGACPQHLSLCDFWGRRQGGGQKREGSRLAWPPVSSCSCLGAGHRGARRERKRQRELMVTSEQHILFLSP